MTSTLRLTNSAAPADGYTLLLVNAAAAINATLYAKLNFNFIRDIAPVAGVIRSPLVMEVNPSVPAMTVPEFIAYAKANPGKITMASAGVGSTSHMSGELFKMMAGVNLVHVPYRGQGPALTDLLGGQVQVYFAGILSSIQYVRAAKLRALAVTTATRSEALPDLPTVGEFMPGYETSNWWGRRTLVMSTMTKWERLHSSRTVSVKMILVFGLPAKLSWCATKNATRVKRVCSAQPEARQTV